MFSPEIPIISPRDSFPDLDSKKKVAFEMNGILVDAGEFGSGNGNDIALAAEKILRANEKTRAEGVGVLAPSESEHEGAVVASSEKNEVFSREFTARLDEAISNLESLSFPGDIDAVAGLGIINLREEIGKDSKESADPNKETEFRFSEWARKQKMALSLAVVFSMLPQSASAQEVGLLGDMWQIIKSATIGGIKQETGEIARKPWEIIKQQEGEAAIKRQQEQNRQQQAENEHLNKVRQFESATTQYRNALRQSQLQFDEQFNRTKDSFASQSVHANTPEQMKLQERNKWLSWLELSRNTVQELKRQDLQYEQAGGSQSEESQEMQAKLKDFVKKAEAKLGIENDEESPLKMTPSTFSRENSQSMSDQPRRSGESEKINPRYRF
jgi:hypothetical protein